jgi:hypothetical protein
LLGELLKVFNMRDKITVDCVDVDAHVVSRLVGFIKHLGKVAGLVRR